MPDKPWYHRHDLRPFGCTAFCAQLLSKHPQRENQAKNADGGSHIGELKMPTRCCQSPMWRMGNRFTHHSPEVSAAGVATTRLSLPSASGARKMPCRVVQ
eukprot:scaffold12129_cov16-Tisochrysis_lutea.AAC.2